MRRVILRLFPGLGLALWLLLGALPALALDSHTATVSTGKVHYVDSGPGTHPLVFIHGWACNLSFWDGQLDAFGPGRRVIALDLPGFGQSDAPEAVYDMDLFIEAVLAVLDQAGVESAILVGHSMGYQISRLFALTHPERVAGLVIVDGAYLRAPEDPQARAEWEQGLAEFTATFSAPGRDESMDGFLEPLFVESTPESIRRKAVDTMKSSPAHAANSALSEFCRAKVWLNESPLSIPVLAVYALSEDYPPDNKEYLLSLFPRMEFHLWENVSHFLMMDRPGEFNALVAAFLLNNGL